MHPQDLSDPPAPDRQRWPADGAAARSSAHTAKGGTGRQRRAGQITGPTDVVWSDRRRRLLTASAGGPGHRADRHLAANAQVWSRDGLSVEASSNAHSKFFSVGFDRGSGRSVGWPSIRSLPRRRVSRGPDSVRPRRSHKASSSLNSRSRHRGQPGRPRFSEDARPAPFEIGVSVTVASPAAGPVDPADRRQHERRARAPVLPGAAPRPRTPTSGRSRARPGR